MTYAERLRNWAGTRITLHERVLRDGRHHVWFYCVYRFDAFDRDFEQACRALWRDATLTFPFCTRSPALVGEPRVTESAIERHIRQAR